MIKFTFDLDKIHIQHGRSGGGGGGGVLTLVGLWHAKCRGVGYVSLLTFCFIHISELLLKLSSMFQQCKL